MYTTKPLMLGQEERNLIEQTREIDASRSDSAAARKLIRNGARWQALVDGIGLAKLRQITKGTPAESLFD